MAASAIFISTHSSSGILLWRFDARLWNSKNQKKKKIQRLEMSWIYFFLICSLEIRATKKIRTLWQCMRQNRISLFSRDKQMETMSCREHFSEYAAMIFGSAFNLLSEELYFPIFTIYSHSNKRFHKDTTSPHFNSFTLQEWEKCNEIFVNFTHSHKWRAIFSTIYQR